MNHQSTIMIATLSQRLAAQELRIQALERYNETLEQSLSHAVKSLEGTRHVLADYAYREVGSTLHLEAYKQINGLLIDLTV